MVIRVELQESLRPQAGHLRRVRVNLVFIMTDQQRADSIGPDRHPCAGFPRMEALGEESIRCTQMFASAIPCVPSRLSMLSGRHEWMSRGHGNARFALHNDRTWMSELRENGFRCVSVGKTHMVHAGSTHVQVPVGASFGEQGGWDHFHPAVSPAREADYFDIATATRGIDVMRRLARSSSPFALFIGFHAPHEPYVMPERFLGSVDPSAVELPAARTDEEYDSKSQAFRRRVEHFRGMFGYVTDDQVREGIAAYHDLLHMIDECVGRILDEIDALGIRDDTAVVFCSDHGDLLGEHGIFNKAATFYESEIRIPLLLRIPGRHEAATSFDGLASGVDIYPTVLDALGVRSTASLPGRSILSMNEGTTTRRSSVTCTNTSGMMIRTQDRKLWYDAQDNDGELYDLSEDPLELLNLYSTDEHRSTRSEMFETLIRERMLSDLAWARAEPEDHRLLDELRTLGEPEIV